MDRERFDALTRALGAPIGRRAGLRALVATAAVVATARLAPDADARVTAQGPCGDRSGKANLCSKDSDCCAGTFCNKALRPMGAKGRCRRLLNAFIPLEDECNLGDTCCGDGICDGGFCLLP